MRTTSEIIEKIEAYSWVIFFMSLGATIVLTIVWIILYQFEWHGMAGNFTDIFGEVFDWIIEKGLIVLFAPVFIIYFVLLAVLQFVGINIGIKEID